MARLLGWMTIWVDDYLKTYYFSDHQWSMVGNRFADGVCLGFTDFTNNQSERINRDFKSWFQAGQFEKLYAKFQDKKKINLFRADWY